MARQGYLSENPTNINLLEDNKFIFTIPNLRFARYFCQSAQIPGVSTQEVLRETPFHQQFHAGDKMNFEPLVISALLDEDLRVWEETFNWLKAEAFPMKFREYRSSVLVRNDIYNDGILEFNKNSNLSNVRIKFQNCHVTSLSPIVMTYVTSETNNIVCDITIRYDTFEVERI